MCDAEKFLKKKPEFKRKHKKCDNTKTVLEIHDGTKKYKICKKCWKKISRSNLSWGENPIKIPERLYQSWIK